MSSSCSHSRLGPSKSIPRFFLLVTTLSDLLEDSDDARNHTWLVERFKAAASKKYHRLQSSMGQGNSQAPFWTLKLCSFLGSLSREIEKLQAYKHVEHLTLGLRQDLEYDLKIQNCKLFPSNLNLPSITAAVFCKVRVFYLERRF